MAQINFGILDTQSPAKIGNAFIRTPEQQNANMLQAMQMQGFINQNELAQSQLRTAKRAEEGQALLGQAYAGTNFGAVGDFAGDADQSRFSSMRNHITRTLAGTPSAYLIPIELAKIAKMERENAFIKKTQGEIEAQNRKNFEDRLRQFQTGVPNVTDAAGVERYVRSTYRDDVIGPMVRSRKPENQAVADALSLYNSPGGANTWIMLNSGLSADKVADLRKINTINTDLGNSIRTDQYDAFGTKVGNSVYTPKGMTPGQTSTAATAEAQRKQTAATAEAQRKQNALQFEANQTPVAVVDPSTGKTIYVSRAEAIKKNYAPASTAEGEMLPMKEKQKREALFPKATSALREFEATADSLAGDLKTLAAHPGLESITGFAAGRLPGITSEGRAAQALYNKIVARGGFQELQNIRNASPTGGGLANISNQEGTQLKNAFAAIDRTQDFEDVSKALLRAAIETVASKGRIREAYDSTYEYRKSSKPTMPGTWGKAIAE